jgi:uncharacterized protein YcfJ
MNMKRNTVAALAIASLFTAAAPAFAQDYRNYDNRYDNRARDDRYRGDVARVIESRPVYAAGDRREECWNPSAGHFEEVRGPEKTRVGKGAAIGAVAGGVLGNQIGDHSTGGTVAGALLGGVLGHQIERRNNDNNDDQGDLDRSRCRVISEGNSNDVVGYDVRYDYRGNEYVARMDRDPGRSLRVGSDVNSDGTPFNSGGYRR